MQLAIDVQEREAQMIQGVQVKRFEVQQILQHAVLMISFILLVITGLPMKFSAWGISIWWANVWGGINVLRSVHHAAAFTIVGLSVYHLLYIGISMVVFRKPFPVRIIPNLQDFIDIYHEFMYFVGFRRDPPRFDRFNWREKFDYWAIFWGMPVMGISGFILLYPVYFTNHVPGWIVPVAYIAHSHEAMLALTWIAIVHIFFNHFSPGVFPLNKSIFTGRVPLERYRRDHPLELKRIERKEAAAVAAEAAAAEPPKSS